MNQQMSRSRGDDIVEGMRRKMRRARTALFLLFGVLAPVVIVSVGLEQGVERARFVIGPAALIVLMAIGGLFGMFKVLENRLIEGVRIMNRVRPRTMVARSLGLRDIKGSILVVLWPEGRTMDSLWSVAILKNMEKHPTFPRKDVKVAVYAESSMTEAEVVVDLGDKVMWGRLVGREGLPAAVRGMRNFTLGLMVCFLIGGAVLNRVGWNDLQGARQELTLARESLSWPGAEGKIVSSTVQKVRISKGKTSVPGCVARVHYTYSESDRIFEGNRFFFGHGPSEDCAWQGALATRFRAGEMVEVYRDPQRPWLSTLFGGDVSACEEKVKDAMYKSVFFAIIWAMLLAVPLGMLIVGRQRWMAVRAMGLTG
ncbi:MAG: DUF3592 domain-containing protein [Deltaproteobacteria bacterium]|nr:DUF3592 domain-containing protein [Deltaproteobacteria bacterium]